MGDIYMLSDMAIGQRMGERLRSVRLKQNITQQSLAEEAGVSLSSVKKIERGEIGSFETLLRVLRILGRLDVLSPLVEEEQLSPNEYYRFLNESAGKQRQRAVGKLDKSQKEESEW